MINGIYCALLVAPYSISAGMNGSVTNMQSASMALIGLFFFFFKNQVFVQMCNFLALLLLWDKGEDSCPEPGALVHQSWVRERKLVQNKGTSAVFGGGQVIVVRHAFPHFYFIGLVWS